MLAKLLSSLFLKSQRHGKEKRPTGFNHSENWLFSLTSTFYNGLLKTLALAEKDVERTLDWEIGFSNWLCY